MLELILTAILELLRRLEVKKAPFLKDLTIEDILYSENKRQKVNKSAKDKHIKNTTNQFYLYNRIFT